MGLFLLLFLIVQNAVLAAEDLVPFDHSTSISKKFFQGIIKDTEIRDLDVFVEDMESNVNATGAGYIWNNINALEAKKAIEIIREVKNGRSLVKLKVKDEDILRKYLEDVSKILERSQGEEESVD